MEKKSIPYKSGELTCKGLFYFNEIVQESRPGILIAPAWRGLDQYVQEKAEAVAKLGYTVFIADLYGNGMAATNDEEAGRLMSPLFLDRHLLRARLIAAYQTFITLERVNKKKIGAMGFCFGGLGVIELLRSGTPIQGAVSFHGLLGYRLGTMEATPVPNAEKISGALLLLHGDKDPLVTQEEIRQIQQEFTEAHVDWQMNIYGNAVHAFTNPYAKEPAKGMAFNKEANARSWRASVAFFEETLGK